MSMKAIWNDVVIAESSDTIIVEKNHYFPPHSVKLGLLRKNGETYDCPWKGHGDYYDIVVDGKTNSGASWMYANPFPDAKEIAGHYAFWKGVNVVP